MGKANLLLLIGTLVWSCSSVSSQEIVSDCGFLNLENPDRIECGKILVPENHDQPGGKKIELAYVVLKSSNPNTSEYPVIYFTGGPGGQALRYLDWHLQNPLLQTRDIIRFDQRGIGHSSALPDLTSRLYGLLPEDLTSFQERSKVVEIIDDLKVECDDLDINVDMYNTFQNARDVGLLMNHLGYEKYNLRGGSYGTRIARIVADYFPEKINAAIYDSPAPHRNDYLLTRMEDYSGALRKVFDFCESDPECSNNYPDIEKTYFEVLKEMEQSPIVATYNNKPYVLNPQDAIFFLRYELYKNGSRELAPRLIYALKNKDMDWINDVVDGRALSSANYGMFLSCENYEEYDHDITAEVVEAKYNELNLLPYEIPIFTSMYLASHDFLSSYATEEMKSYKQSEVPSLIFNNQFDPVTPPENVGIFQETLPNSWAFIINEGGHGGGDMACKSTIMENFLRDPWAVPDGSCLDLYEQ